MLATKEGWRVTGLACVAGGICVRVLYCFCGGVTPAHPASFAGYDKLPDNQTQPTLEMTPGFKPFTVRQINHFCILGFVIKRQKSDKHCKLIPDVICALCFFAGGGRRRVCCEQSSLRKHPFLLTLRRWGHFARNVPCSEERGEKDVFAGYEQSLMAEFSF